MPNERLWALERAPLALTEWADFRGMTVITARYPGIQRPHSSREPGCSGHPIGRIMDWAPDGLINRMDPLHVSPVPASSGSSPMSLVRLHEC
jgi:hypothetical protein